MLRALALLLALLIGQCSGSAPLPDLPFLQPIATKLLYSGSPIEGFVQLPYITSASQVVHGAISGSASNNTFIVLSDTHLFNLDLSSFPPLVTPLDGSYFSNLSIAASSHLASTNGYLVILSNVTSSICSLQSGYCKPLPAANAHVTASCVSDAGDVYFGTESGLYVLSMTSFSISPLKQLPSDEPISALAWDSVRSYLWVGTKGLHHKLHFFDPTDTKPKNWQYFYAHYVAAHHVSSLAFDQAGNLWIADNGSLCMIAPDWSSTWLSGDDGVPHLDILRVHTSPSGAVWAGTMYGAWRFYEGHWKVRVLPPF